VSRFSTLASVSGAENGDALEMTLREFASGQKLFNRYTLKKVLGRGGMGVVWLAHDDDLERDVALKFLPELIVHDRAVLGDLKRETRRSLDLTHKNIVRIYDFVHNQQSGCISMEYVDGDTLSNLRADKPNKIFEPHELADWTSQLCDALDYAHNHARIIHRDLKPANLMVNQRGDLKVSDFGIARSLSDSVSMITMDHGKSGTLVYMSPQQLEGEKSNHLDDIYSLGASVYELLTSRPPFTSGNIDRQIREKIPPSMTQRRKDLEIEGEPIDATWERVIAQCLAKDPAGRPQSVAQIAQQLEIASPKTRRAQQAVVEKAKASGFPVILAALKARPLVLAGAVALVCAVGLLVMVLGLYFAFRKPAKQVTTSPPVVALTPSAPAPAPATGTGGVVLDTSPSGATVLLGGLDAGRSPVTFKGVRAGKYQLRVSKDGYVPIEKEIEVKPDEFLDLGTMTLQRAKFVTERKKETPAPEQAVTTPAPPNPPPPANTQQPANSQQLAIPLTDFTGG
jgi:hypothetical protein